MSSSNARTPLVCLLDDVLQQIFLWSTIDSADEDIGCFGSHGSSLRRLPQLSISHVCSTWRQVAFLTPRLWNRVQISDIFHPKIAIAEEWLSRARNIPVSIKVAVSIGDNDVNMYCSSLLLFLSPYRIRDLKMYFDKVIPSLNLSARNVADLKTFIIVYHQGYHRGSIELNISQYPKLFHLDVDHHCTFSGTCNSLVKLHVPRCFLSLREILDILSSSASLEEFTISVRHDNSEKSPIAKNIHLPHLRILRFIFSAENAPIPVASMIDSLTLSHLEIFYIQCPVDWSTPAFGALVKRSNGLLHLTYFHLDSPTFSVDAGGIISLIPSITKLSLYTTSMEQGCKVIFDTDTLTRLAIGALGPQLEYIRVGPISNPQEFMDMVESRTENAQKCSDGTLMPFSRRVRFDTRGCDASVLSHLRRLEQRGVPIDN